MITFICAIVCLLIGIFIGRKSMLFDGLFITNDQNDKWTLDVKIDPNTIPSKKEIRLKVVKMSEGDV